MKPTIGLEIHAELATDSKLFCGCANEPEEKKPNVHICPTCLGYPGSLPVVNKKAIESMIKIGTALNGTCADFSEFDRKHYFYPDIPKGYQISQYKHPLVKGGSLKGVDITRVHLEEDTARSTHRDNVSLIDFNRSGVPLMELVTEPVIHDGDTASAFAEELRLVLQTLGVARARMQWGEMRVEANISVSDTEELGTKVEIKNLNSFKAVKDSIAFEIKRQTEMLGRGESVVQETRGWNDEKKITFSQRIKETSEEYRYFPEPDIPKMYISKVPEWSQENIKKTLPELPQEKRKRYLSIGLPKDGIEILMRDMLLCSLFELCIEHTKEAKTVMNILVSEGIPLAADNDAFFDNVTGERLAWIVNTYSEGGISSRGVKDILGHLAKNGGNPKDIAGKLSLFQESDEGVLLESIDKICKKEESTIEEYKNGKESVLQYLIGQVMKETKGSANPQVVEKLLKKKLSK